MKEKLIRDKIVEIIKSKGVKPEFRIAREDEIEYFVLKKLLEEVNEFRKQPSVEEFIDIIEVMSKIKRFYNYEEESLIKKRQIKAREKGKFEANLILNIDKL